MSTKLTHRQVEALLGAYALDAVDPQERDIVAHHLIHCSSCRSEVADCRETTAGFAFAEVPPSSALWDRIASELEDAPPMPEPAP